MRTSPNHRKSLAALQPASGGGTNNIQLGSVLVTSSGRINHDRSSVGGVGVPRSVDFTGETVSVIRMYQGTDRSQICEERPVAEWAWPL